MPHLNRDRRPRLLHQPAPAAAKSAAARKPIRIRALAQGSAQLDIYGDIGLAVNAGDILGGLRGIEAETLEIRINSQGGNAWDGLAIYNDLCSLSCAREVVITGIAGSAASIIAMAGDTIKMHDTAQFFIHQAWLEAAGNADFLEQLARELRTTDSAMARIYAARTGIPEDEIRVLMRAETLLSAQEAFDLGFCDEIIGLGGAQAKRRPAPRARQSSSERAAVAQLATGLRTLATQIRGLQHA